MHTSTSYLLGRLKKLPSHTADKSGKYVNISFFPRHLSYLFADKRYKLFNPSLARGLPTLSNFPSLIVNRFCYIIKIVWFFSFTDRFY